jgi:hypothetical protein
MTAMVCRVTFFQPQGYLKSLEAPMHKYWSLFFKFAHGFRTGCNFTVLSRNGAQTRFIVAYP